MKPISLRFWRGRCARRCRQALLAVAPKGGCASNAHGPYPAKGARPVGASSREVRWVSGLLALRRTYLERSDPDGPLRFEPRQALLHLGAQRCDLGVLRRDLGILLASKLLQFVEE